MDFLFYLAFAGAWCCLIWYWIYSWLYYKGEKFANLKSEVQDYIDDCNGLNEHIEDLKNTYIEFKQVDYGQSNFVDYSAYKYKRTEYKRYVNSKYVYNCSLTVCRGAQQQPFKYLCKYFNIKPDEVTLNNFEEVLNNFAAVEQGKILLNNKKKDVLNGIWGKVPWVIKTFDKNRFEKKLGFQAVDFSQLYFPTYTFNYVSSGGNSSMRTTITLNIENLNRFVVYLSDLVKYRASVAGQRALMTTDLREKIKQRDCYTCQRCKNSTYNEPNLLLEIDHIIPLSKGGMTTEDNLQTLCWKCNRNKGTQIINYSNVTPNNMQVADEHKPAEINRVSDINSIANTQENNMRENKTAPRKKNVVQNKNEEEDIYSKILNYKKLLDDGIIDQEEFTKLKSKLIDK